VNDALIVKEMFCGLPILLFIYWPFGVICQKQKLCLELFVFNVMILAKVVKNVLMCIK